MRTIRRIFDRIALAYIRRRVARFRSRGDFADRFADCLTAALQAEIERRNRLLAGWAAELEAARATETAARRAREAVERFQSFEPEKDRLRLQ